MTSRDHFIKKKSYLRVSVGLMILLTFESQGVKCLDCKVFCMITTNSKWRVFFGYNKTVIGWLIWIRNNKS